MTKKKKFVKRSEITFDDETIQYVYMIGGGLIIFLTYIGMSIYFKEALFILIGCMVTATFIVLPAFWGKTEEWYEEKK